VADVGEEGVSRDEQRQPRLLDVEESETDEVSILPQHISDRGVHVGGLPGGVVFDEQDHEDDHEDDDQRTSGDPQRCRRHGRK
jgi:hypothetical protein